MGNAKKSVIHTSKLKEGQHLFYTISVTIYKLHWSAVSSWCEKENRNVKNFKIKFQQIGVKLNFQ